MLATETVSTIPDKYADSQQRGGFFRCEAKQEFVVDMVPVAISVRGRRRGLRTRDADFFAITAPCAAKTPSDFCREPLPSRRSGKMLEETRLDYALVTVFVEVWISIGLHWLMSPIARG